MARYTVTVDLAEPETVDEWVDYIEERNLVWIELINDKTEAIMNGPETNIRAALSDYFGGDNEAAADYFETYAEKVED